MVIYNNNNNNKRNYIFIRTIVTDIVSEGLRTFFKQEWNTRYRATLGEWDDTPISGQELYNREKTRSRAKEYLPKFKHGNTSEWDCTVLFDLILYSNSIGKPALHHSIRKEVDSLRNLRNNILHVCRGQLPDGAFENASKKVRNSFKVLGLPITEIDKIISEKRRKLFSFHILIIIISVILVFLSCIYFTNWLQPSANSKHVSNAIFKVLPPHPIHEVVNRTGNVTAIINDLRELYKSNNGKLTYFYISGNPGSGKSQLSRSVGELYDGYANLSGLTFVMTLNAETLQDLLESYGDFARRLNCTERIVANIIDSTQSTVKAKIRQLKTQIATRIKTYHSWLVIVDNVENLTLVSSLLPQLGDKEWNGGQVLITTQDSLSIPPNSSLTVHISVSSGMGVIESCYLLATLFGTGIHPMLSEVAKQLDYQPLAMAAAAVYLKQVRETKVSPEFSWRDYLEKLNVGKRQPTDDQLSKINPAYSLTMATAVRLAVEKAAETDLVLNHTFNFLSLTSHDSLPLEVPINYVLLVDKNQDKEQVGIKIRKCSLILPADSQVVSIRLHRIVHDAIKVYASKRKLENSMSRFEIVARSFYQSKHKFVGRTLVSHLKVYHDAMTKIPWNNKTLCSVFRSSEIPKVFSYFGSVVFRYGEYSSTKHFLTTALQILQIRDKGGDGSGEYLKEISDIHNDLGVLYERLGDLQQAMKYHKLAQGAYIKQLGSEHVRVAVSYSNLGSVHQALGNFPQAKLYHKSALDIRLNKLEPNHADIAASYNNLGNVQQALGDLQDAKQYYERALDIYKKQLGSNHLDVVRSYNNLGTVHEALGDLQQAKQCHERAFVIRIKLLGSNHVDVAASFNNLGMVHTALGDLQQAKKYHERALIILLKHLGSNHVDVATSYVNLGNVHQELVDLQQAKQHYKRALDIYQKQLGSNNVKVATCYNNLGSVHQALGDLEQAKQYHKRSLDIRIKKLGSNHVDVGFSYSNSGKLHKALGEPQQAKEYHKLALDIYIKQLGSNHVHVATCYNDLGSVYQDLGDLQQAKQYHERALDIYIKRLGSNHVNVADSYNDLGNVHQASRDLKQAKQYHELALDIYINKLGSNHVKVAVSYNNLGSVHQDLGDPKRAKQYYVRALDIYIKQLGPNHMYVATCYNDLGSVYQDLGDLQQAKQYRERAQDILLDIRLKQLGANDAVVVTSKISDVF